MECITKPLLDIEEYKKLIESIKKNKGKIGIEGITESQKAHLVYSISEHLSTKGIFVAHNELAARKVFEDLTFFLKDEVCFFSSPEIFLHEIVAESSDVHFQRLEVLNRLVEGNYKVLVTSIEALTKQIISPKMFKESILNISLRKRINIHNIQQKLVFLGYERTDIVEGKGQFAIKGGIIDIYPVNYLSPIRIELFDDEVDSIRSFDISSQRSLEKLENIKIIPSREVIYEIENRNDFIEDIKKDLKKFIKKTERNEKIEEIQERIYKDVDKFNNEYYFPGIEKYINYIYKKKAIITDYVGSKGLIFLDQPSKLSQSLENLKFEHNETCFSLLEKAKILPNCLDLLYSFEDIIEKVLKNSIITIEPFNSSNNLIPIEQKYKITFRTVPSYQGNMELLFEDIKTWKKNNNRILILSGIKAKAKRLKEILLEKDIYASYVDDCNFEIEPGQVFISHGTISRGFEYPQCKLVVVGDKEVFGQDKKSSKKIKNPKGKKINIFTDLKVGDYIVHYIHGIGIYEGIIQLDVDNIKKDYFKINYVAGDSLYVPIEQMDLIQKFIGGEGKKPKVNKLGGAEWGKAKKKVKESLREVAEELIKLYAKREAARGFAFSEDTVWQKQMEDLFPYDETDDQNKCIEDIKKDMESIKPMDRLLCGDVGFGKTEVATRAIFKAIMDGKQVVYLVPTTVLAEQQYKNFKERMKDFPVTVEGLSRFRSASQQKSILKNLKTGMVDIVVGTHRVIQKDVEFKDLGLLVVDEEQRFGVSHKEKIKQLKNNIDVLTLTATPIPRTLHMSLVGIKDISVIEDPPENRHPVQTYVMEYNASMIKDAIERELSRTGQIFYLYNSVRTIEIKEAEIRRLVPSARIAVAHGQLDEKKLEEIMQKFINGEYDVLICTTIIESGLDMPNVNTIIVEDADRMGLSQLYQLRGRVGRSNRMAYAYITYKKDKIISEIAEKRLTAIREFTDLGSGFKIAMRDLEIRGSGNLLGSQQHGHIDSVGYDMYCRLLEKSVQELRGEAVENDEDKNVLIDIKVSAYIDDNYITNEVQKIEMYKKISSIQSQEDVQEITEELIDRFGDIPKPVTSLMDISLIKYLAQKCKITNVLEKEGNGVLQYGDEKDIDLSLIGKIMTEYKRQVLFSASSKPYLTYKPKKDDPRELLHNIKILLQYIKKMQSN